METPTRCRGRVGVLLTLTTVYVLVYVLSIKANAPIRAPIQDILDQSPHMYCMMWCPSSGAEAKPMQAPLIQTSVQTFMNLTCCKVCTLKACFTTLVDSRVAKSHHVVEDDISVVTFGTQDRIKAFDRVNKLWPGPKVLLLYLDNYNSSMHEINNHLDSVKEMASSRWSNVLVLYYIARIEQDSETFSSWNVVQLNDSFTIPMMPINTLRNVVLDLAQTKWVFPLDLDFYPSRNAYRKLLNLVQFQWTKKPNSKKFALVLPHFEFRSCFLSQAVENIEEAYPEDFDAFLSEFNKGRVRPFHSCFGCFKFAIERMNFDPISCNQSSQDSSFDPGAFTGYENWIQESPGLERVSDLGSISHISLASVNRFWEPYFVLPTRGAIRYNELFTGRYFDKTSFVASLVAFDYAFFRVNGEFLFHQDHPDSPLKLPLKAAFHEHYRRMKTVFDIYIPEIWKHYNSSLSSIGIADSAY